jgi:Carboxypeptidase regulatory-like domain/TonB-dependent Receptor Plug Domain
MKIPIGTGRLLWLGLTMILFASLAMGQEKAGSLAGTASDDTDAVLPGVTVTLTNKATHRITSERTGPYGDYTIREVPAGQYSVAFTLAGFARTEVPDVEILVAQNRRLDVRLKPGAPSTVVVVTDTAPLIDTQNSSVVLHITQDEFDRLPKARTYQQLANLASGVNTGEIGGGIQINGASGAENAYLIDGVATQSAIVGTSRQDAVFDYVQEIQVQTSGVDASYSGALGGVISAVTRSGGNQFHGSTWVYYSADPLSAAPAPRLVLDPNDNRTVGTYQNSKTSWVGQSCWIGCISTPRGVRDGRSRISCIGSAAAAKPAPFGASRPS